MAEKTPIVYNEGYRPRASTHNLREGIKSNFWFDLSAWIEGRIYEGRDELEDPAMPLEHQSFKRGYIRAMREVLAMPGEMLSAQEDEIKDKQEETKNE